MKESISNKNSTKHKALRVLLLVHHKEANLHQLVEPLLPSITYQKLAIFKISKKLRHRTPPFKIQIFELSTILIDTHSML